MGLYTSNVVREVVPDIICFEGKTFRQSLMIKSMGVSRTETVSLKSYSVLLLMVVCVSSTVYNLVLILYDKPITISEDNDRCQLNIMLLTYQYY